MIKTRKPLITAIIIFLALPLFSADSDVRINSIGFLPTGAKGASVVGGCTGFDVRRASDGTSVYSGTCSGANYQNDVGQTVAKIDFTSLTEEGEFYLDVGGVGRSVNFTIAQDVYNVPYYHVMRAMYLWRCGMAVDGWYDGDHFQTGACHLNDGYQDYIGGGHNIKDGTQGWHDAGDYGKYIVNAGITVGMMFRAWEMYQPVLENITLDIPDTAPGYPDFLKEMKWEMDWVLKMQYYDSGAGGYVVSHKLTRTDFSGFIMPEDDTADRYFVDWGSAATADFVAMCAMASRIFRPYDSAYADTLLAAAWDSYNFLLANTANKAPDQSAFSTGGYTTNDSDDRLWAAAEMWETTGDSTAHNDFINRANGYSDKTDVDWDWSNQRNLGMYTYLLSSRGGKDSAVVNDIRNDLINDANTLVGNRNADVYARPLGGSYYWGCNGALARTTMNLLVANEVSPSRDYVDAALDSIGHVFGRNYYNRSYVTGMGIDPPMYPHDRRSGADGITNPWPAYLVGGGHSATDWEDVEESYSTNEIAINWQGALIFALAAFTDIAETPTFTPTITGTPPTSTITPTSTQTPVFDGIYVNCGNGLYNDGTRDWLADQEYSGANTWGYTGGQTGNTPDPIAGTTDDELYQDERWDDPAYTFEVPDGEYEIWFRFAETYWGSGTAGGGTGSRVFDVYAEGSIVINDLDIYDLAGHDTAYDLFIPVTVTDGILNITTISSADNAKFNAIGIRRQEPTPTNTPNITSTYTATWTVTNTGTPTETSTFSFTATPSSTGTSTFTLTGTPSNTPPDTPSDTPTETYTGTYTYTATLTHTPADTFTLTETPSDTQTATLTRTGTPTGTLSPEDTFTYTPTDSPTFTNTSTQTATGTLSSTLTHTPTYTATGTLSFTRTNTPVLSPTPSYTGTPPTATHTPSVTLTHTGTLTSTHTPQSTLTNTPTQTLTGTFSPTLTGTPTYIATGTLSSTLTGTPTYTMTGTQSFTRTNTPVLSPTPSYTGTPPTATHTPSVTLTHTGTFTSTHTPQSTLTYTPTQTMTVTLTYTETPAETHTQTPVITPVPEDADEFEITDEIIYPNPYNPDSGIELTIKADFSRKHKNTRVKIYTSALRCVREAGFPDSPYAGIREIKAPVSLYTGLANGIYFYIITAEDYDGKGAKSKIQSLVILK